MASFPLGSLPLGSGASQAAAPTDLCYGMRIGIRSCADQRYVAAFQRSDRATFDLEVSGYHPFRQSDVTDRISECPSEWVVLQHSVLQYRGPIHIGDDVCFVKDFVSTGERRKDRHRLFLALRPPLEGTSMSEPTVERLENGTDICKWTLLHADDPSYSGSVKADTPLTIRGKHHERLACGRTLGANGSNDTANFRSPARASGKSLIGRTITGYDSTMACSPKEIRFRLVRAGMPFMPEPWSRRRASWVQQPPANLGSMDNFALLGVQMQQQFLLEDILFCLLGIEGSYFRRVTSERSIQGVPSLPEVRFEIATPAEADVSTVSFLQQVLPLCEQHVAVQEFVRMHSHYEYGTVNHALCTAIRKLLKEFSTKINNLEVTLRSGNLTVAKLWYHLQPSMGALTLLHKVASYVFRTTGGQVLNGIEEIMSRSSSTSAQDLCEHLLQEASRPYFQMLSKWVYDGILDDPYNEFFILENPRVRDEKTGGPAADFWQKHFTLQEHSVPQLLKESREKILHAGKYLHVFHSVAPNAQLPREDETRSLLKYSRQRKDCKNAIDAAYRRASTALLGFFMSPRPQGLDLPGRLTSMRDFFFLSKADWFGQLMDSFVDELEQSAAEVSLPRLEGFLDVAIRSSSVSSDRYRDNIACSMHSFKVEEVCKRVSKGQSLPTEDPDVKTEPSSGLAIQSGSSRASFDVAAAVLNRNLGIEHPQQASTDRPSSTCGGGQIPEDSSIRHFTLKYHTSWPISIIFSRGLMIKYQIIFRHLLFCRYVERKLVEVWIDHQFTKGLGIGTSYSPLYALRQKMLHFCRDYIYYASVEVLEPQSHRFLSSLKEAETIDEVIKNHENFLDSCLRELLLTKREELFKLLTKVFNCCLTFANGIHYAMHKFEHDASKRDGLHAHETMSKDRRLERLKEDQKMYTSFMHQKNNMLFISKFKGIFERQLQDFLQRIRQESTQNYEAFLGNMLTRLDYNEYYSAVLTKAASGTAPPSPAATRTPTSTTTPSTTHP